VSYYDSCYYTNILLCYLTTSADGLLTNEYMRSALFQKLKLPSNWNGEEKKGGESGGEPLLYNKMLVCKFSRFEV